MTLQLVGVAEEIFLGLDVPKAVMSLAEAVELSVDRIGLALLLELGDSGQRHLYVSVNQLLPTFDLRQVNRRLRHNVKASDMGHKTGRVQTLAHHLESLLHVISVSATGTHDVCGSIMDIVEIERSLEIRTAGAGEEVEATVLTQDLVTLLHNCGNGSHHDHIVEACAARDLAETLSRILNRSGIHIT